ncbi:Glycoprotein-polysaccharide metabolism [Klebsiella variicola]|nr:Glycoprotein-polysaccharide metabolism [Klebsiella variicola]
MKFAYMFSALAVAATLTACANHHSTSSSTQAAAPDPYGIATLSVAQQQPSVTGTINIRQRIALPPDAVLTVTLSDASLADAPARVLSQKAVRTEGKQAPFNFALPYNPADIQPNARILLSAAIAVKRPANVHYRYRADGDKPGWDACRPDAGSGHADRRPRCAISSPSPLTGAFFCLQ